MAAPIFDNNANKAPGTTGNDNYNGLGGNDTISGAGGDDTLNGGLGNDSLNGGVGNDKLIGDKGVDTLIGDSGHDSLNGGADNDKLDGGAGNDSLDGGTGADAMTGGDGNDAYWVDNAKDTVTEKSGTTSGTDTVTSAVNYTLGANLENLILLKTGMTGLMDSSALNGTGNELKNVITGNAGNNYLDGKGGDDQLIGGGGNDTLDGGAGKDKLTGGDGSDTYMVTNTGTDIIVETKTDGDQDVVESNITYTLGSYLEVLTLTGTNAIDGTGNDLDNTITGNDAVNFLNGDAGDDVINGGAGNDEIDGGAGNDEIDGGEGLDTVVYQGDQASYSVTSDDEGKWTVEYTGSESEDGVDGGLNEGTDSIINVETLSFADGDLPLGSTPPIPNLGTLIVEFDDPETVVREGSTLSLMITLSEASAQDVTINYTVEDWTTDPSDYEVSPQDSITIAAGDTVGYLEIAAMDDGVVEGYEELTITLTDADGAAIYGMNVAIVGINDML